MRTAGLRFEQFSSPNSTCCGWLDRNRDRPSGFLDNQRLVVARMLFRLLGGLLFLRCAQRLLLAFLIGPLFMGGHIGSLLHRGLGTWLS